MTPAISTERATVYQSTWLELAATLPTNLPGASLAIVDGPYNMKKADWDTFRDWDHFCEWYEVELRELGRVLEQDATVYLWGSDESEGRLRPVMRSLGWTRLGSITWDKGTTPNAMGWAQARTYSEATESCSHWVRGAPPWTPQGPTSNVWQMGYKNYQEERLRTGELIAPLSRLNGETAGYVCGPTREPLHPCQKPLAFYDRLIRSSSRPGDIVLEPYGGTLRAAVACQRLPPDQARHAIVSEPHGPYIEAVRPSLEFVAAESGAQPSLFAPT
jgi:DNA modification methylase